MTTDADGKMGLESICQKNLKGHPGKIIKIINAIGHHIQAHQARHALAGKTLKTTLNASLQRSAEELFPKDFEGCCILMDEMGALEVIVSRPSFDPSMFLRATQRNAMERIARKAALSQSLFECLLSSCIAL